MRSLRSTRFTSPSRPAASARQTTTKGWIAWKPCIDALVRFGWAKDDSERWMEQVVLPVIVDKTPRTEIVIEKVSFGIPESESPPYGS